MTIIPQDPFMLLSWVNTQLRDHYPNIQCLCDDLEIDRNEIDAALAKAGFGYNRGQNKYW